jgi:hypothetical protein
MIEYINHAVKARTWTHARPPSPTPDLAGDRHTARAEAEQLHQVGADAKAGALLQLLHQALHPAVIEALQRPTVGADEVVTVALAQAVAVALVQPVDALERVEVAEQPHRAECSATRDTRATCSTNISIQKALRTRLRAMG